MQPPGQSDTSLLFHLTMQAVVVDQQFTVETIAVLDQGGGIIPAGWVAATRDANPSVFGAPYTEVLPGGAYRNQWWVEDTQSRALYARGVFGQMISVNWDHRMVAVKLSSWPDFQNPNLTRATMRALHAIAEHLS